MRLYPFRILLNYVHFCCTHIRRLKSIIRALPTINLYGQHFNPRLMHGSSGEDLGETGHDFQDRTCLFFPKLDGECFLFFPRLILFPQIQTQKKEVKKIGEGGIWATDYTL